MDSGPTDRNPKCTASPSSIPPTPQASSSTWPVSPVSPTSPASPTLPDRTTRPGPAKSHAHKRSTPTPGRHVKFAPDASHQYHYPNIPPETIPGSFPPDFEGRPILRTEYVPTATNMNSSLPTTTPQFLHAPDALQNDNLAHANSRIRGFNPIGLDTMAHVYATSPTAPPLLVRHFHALRLRVVLHLQSQSN